MERIVYSKPNLKKFKATVSFITVVFFIFTSAAPPDAYAYIGRNLAVRAAAARMEAQPDQPAQKELTVDERFFVRQTEASEWFGKLVAGLLDGKNVGLADSTVLNIIGPRGRRTVKLQEFTTGQAGAYDRKHDEIIDMVTAVSVGKNTERPIRVKITQDQTGKITGIELETFNPSHITGLNLTETADMIDTILHHGENILRLKPEGIKFTCPGVPDPIAELGAHNCTRAGLLGNKQPHSLRQQGILESMAEKVGLQNAEQLATYSITVKRNRKGHLVGIDIILDQPKRTLLPNQRNIATLVSEINPANPQTLLAVCPMSREVVRGSFETAQISGSSVAFVASRRQVDNVKPGYTGWDQQELVQVIKEEAERIGFTGPVSIGRDHGGPGKITSEKAMKEAEKSLLADIAAGFDSFMVDCSSFNKMKGDNLKDQYEANIEATIRLIKFIDQHMAGRLYSLEVEASEPGGDELTTEAEIRHFLSELHRRLAEAGIEKRPDLIVCHTGTTHGDNPSDVNVEVAHNLDQVAREFGCRIAQHGTSRTPTSTLIQLTGVVAKANVATDLAKAQTRATLEVCPQLREILLANEDLNEENLLSQARAHWIDDDVQEALSSLTDDQQRTIQQAVTMAVARYHLTFNLVSPGADIDDLAEMVKSLVSYRDIDQALEGVAELAELAEHGQPDNVRREARRVLCEVVETITAKDNTILKLSQDPWREDLQGRRYSPVASAALEALGRLMPMEEDFIPIILGAVAGTETKISDEIRESARNIASRAVINYIVKEQSVVYVDRAVKALQKEAQKTYGFDSITREDLISYLQDRNYLQRKGTQHTWISPAQQVENMKTGKVIDMDVWTAMLHNLSEVPEIEKTEVTITLDSGLVHSLLIPRELLLADNNEHIVRFLTKRANNLGLNWGTSCFIIETSHGDEEFDRQLAWQMARHVQDLREDGKKKTTILRTHKASKDRMVEEEVIVEDLTRGLPGYANKARPVEFIARCDVDDRLLPGELTLPTTDKDFDPAHQGLFLGVDIGGTNIKISLKQDGEVIFHTTTPTNAESGGPTVLEAVKKAVQEAISFTYANRQQIRYWHGQMSGQLGAVKITGSTIVIAGNVDVSTNQNITWGNLEVGPEHEWTNEDKECLNNQLNKLVKSLTHGAPIVRRNDMYGFGTALRVAQIVAGVDIKDATAVALGSGMGYAPIVNGVMLAIVRDRYGRAIQVPAEGGHIQVSTSLVAKRHEGVCEFVGCAEQLVSMDGMIALAEEKGFRIDKDELEVKDLAIAAREYWNKLEGGRNVEITDNEKIAKEVFDEVGERIAQVMIESREVFGPEIAGHLILAGGISQAKEVITRPIEEALKRLDVKGGDIQVVILDNIDLEYANADGAADYASYLDQTGETFEDIEIPQLKKVYLVHDDIEGGQRAINYLEEALNAINLNHSDNVQPIILRTGEAGIRLLGEVDKKIADLILINDEDKARQLAEEIGFDKVLCIAGMGEEELSWEIAVRSVEIKPVSEYAKGKDEIFQRLQQLALINGADQVQFLDQNGNPITEQWLAKYSRSIGSKNVSAKRYAIADSDDGVIDETERGFITAKVNAKILYRITQKDNTVCVQAVNAPDATPAGTVTGKVLGSKITDEDVDRTLFRAAQFAEAFSNLPILPFKVITGYTRTELVSTTLDLLAKDDDRPEPLAEKARKLLNMQLAEVLDKEEFFGPEDFGNDNIYHALLKDARIVLAAAPTSLADPNLLTIDKNNFAVSHYSTGANGGTLYFADPQLKILDQHARAALLIRTALQLVIAREIEAKLGRRLNVHDENDKGILSVINDVAGAIEHDLIGDKLNEQLAGQTEDYLEIRRPYGTKEIRVALADQLLDFYLTETDHGQRRKAIFSCTPKLRHGFVTVKELADEIIERVEARNLEIATDIIADIISDLDEHSRHLEQLHAFNDQFGVLRSEGRQLHNLQLPPAGENVRCIVLGYKPEDLDQINSLLDQLRENENQVELRMASQGDDLTLTGEGLIPYTTDIVLIPHPDNHSEHYRRIIKRAMGDLRSINAQRSAFGLPPVVVLGYEIPETTAEGTRVNVLNDTLDAGQEQYLYVDLAEIKNISEPGSVTPAKPADFASAEGGLVIPEGWREAFARAYGNLSFVAGDDDRGSDLLDSVGDKEELHLYHDEIIAILQNMDRHRITDLSDESVASWIQSAADRGWPQEALTGFMKGTDTGNSFYNLNAFLVRLMELRLQESATTVLTLNWTATDDPSSIISTQSTSLFLSVIAAVLFHETRGHLRSAGGLHGNERIANFNVGRRWRYWNTAARMWFYLAPFIRETRMDWDDAIQEFVSANRDIYDWLDGEENTAALEEVIRLATQIDGIWQADITTGAEGILTVDNLISPDEDYITPPDDIDQVTMVADQGGVGEENEAVEPEKSPVDQLIDKLAATARERVKLDVTKEMMVEGLTALKGGEAGLQESLERAIALCEAKRINDNTNSLRNLFERNPQFGALMLLALAWHAEIQSDGLIASCAFDTKEAAAVCEAWQEMSNADESAAQGIADDLPTYPFFTWHMPQSQAELTDNRKKKKTNYTLAEINDSVDDLIARIEKVQAMRKVSGRVNTWVSLRDTWANEFQDIVETCGKITGEVTVNISDAEREFPKEHRRAQDVDGCAEDIGRMIKGLTLLKGSLVMVERSAERSAVKAAGDLRLPTTPGGLKRAGDFVRQHAPRLAMALRITGPVMTKEKAEKLNKLNPGQAIVMRKPDEEGAGYVQGTRDSSDNHPLVNAFQLIVEAAILIQHPDVANKIPNHGIELYIIDDGAQEDCIFRAGNTAIYATRHFVEVILMLDAIQEGAGARFLAPFLAHEIRHTAQTRRTSLYAFSDELIATAEQKLTWRDQLTSPQDLDPEKLLIALKDKPTIEITGDTAIIHSGHEEIINLLIAIAQREKEDMEEEPVDGKYQAWPKIAERIHGQLDWEIQQDTQWIIDEGHHWRLLMQETIMKHIQGGVLCLGKSGLTRESLAFARYAIEKRLWEEEGQNAEDEGRKRRGARQIGDSVFAARDLRPGAAVPEEPQTITKWQDSLANAVIEYAPQQHLYCVIGGTQFYWRTEDRLHSGRFTLPDDLADQFSRYNIQRLTIERISGNDPERYQLEITRALTKFAETGEFSQGTGLAPDDFQKRIISQPEIIDLADETRRLQFSANLIIEEHKAGGVTEVREHFRQELERAHDRTLKRFFPSVDKSFDISTKVLAIDLRALIEVDRSGNITPAYSFRALQSIKERQQDQPVRIALVICDDDTRQMVANNALPFYLTRGIDYDLIIDGSEVNSKRELAELIKNSFDGVERSQIRAAFSASYMSKPSSAFEGFGRVLSVEGAINNRSTAKILQYLLVNEEDLLDLPGASLSNAATGAAKIIQFDASIPAPQLLQEDQLRRTRDLAGCA